MPLALWTSGLPGWSMPSASPRRPVLPPHPGCAPSRMTTSHSGAVKMTSHPSSSTEHPHRVTLGPVILSGRLCLPIQVPPLTVVS